MALYVDLDQLLKLKFEFCSVRMAAINMHSRNYAIHDPIVTCVLCFISQSEQEMLDQKNGMDLLSGEVEAGAACSLKAMFGRAKVMLHQPARRACNNARQNASETQQWAAIVKRCVQTEKWGGFNATAAASCEPWSRPNVSRTAK